MTTPKQRRANRLNALKSCGLKSEQGKQRASRNAAIHRLSQPLAPEMIEGELARLAELIVQDGLDLATGRELAARIIEFERNMTYQRSLFAEDTVDKPSVKGHLAGDVQEIFEVMAEYPAAARASVFKELRSVGKMVQRASALLIRVNAARRKNALRYVKRSSNQLIKLLKRSH